MNYTIYFQSTGEIAFEFAGSLESLLQNINTETQDYIDGIYKWDQYYIENKIPIAISDKPNVWDIFNYVTKQWDQNDALAIQYNIAKRDKLLYASDWTQIPNNPLTAEQQAAWAVYRQELRDITSQSGYPFNVIWPTPPQG